MVRKTMTGALMTGLLAASLPWKAYALGLGEIALQSGLNQPLEAEIALYDVERMPLETIHAKLASREAFAQAGIKRTLALSYLRFHPVRRRDGETVIKVTSKRPVRVPVLDFLVTVTWPQGHLTQEYTVLLDPIAFSKPDSSADTQNRVDSVYGPTQAGDTLWQIAQQVRPNPSITIQQMMLALQRANPSAFLHRNINGLKVGKVLQVPPVEEVLEASPAEATRQVRQQNRAWTELRERGSMYKDRTSLTAAGEQEVGTGAKKAGLRAESGRHLGEQLSLAMKTLHSRIREKNDLRARLQAARQADSRSVEQQMAVLQQFLGDFKQAPETSVLTSGKPAKGASIAGFGSLFRGSVGRSMEWKNLLLGGGGLLFLVLVVSRMRRRKAVKDTLPSTKTPRIVVEAPGAALEPAMISSHLNTSLEPRQEAAKKPPLRATGSAWRALPPKRNLEERSAGVAALSSRKRLPNRVYSLREEKMPVVAFGRRRKCG